MTGLSQEQVDKLLAPIKPRRVMTSQGQSHVAAFDVIAHLTRIFGFCNWDKEILSLDLVHERIEKPETGNGPWRCWVTYRCLMRLTVKAPDGTVLAHFEDAATGSAQNMPGVGDAHDFAVKNAVSYAVKRCAKDLGDQFGLSLYNGGQTRALVGRTLVNPNANTSRGDVEEHAPEPLTLGNDERVAPEDVVVPSSDSGESTDSDAVEGRLKPGSSPESGTPEEPDSSDPGESPAEPSSSPGSPPLPAVEVEVAQAASDETRDAAKKAIAVVRKAGKNTQLSTALGVEDLSLVASSWTESDAVRVRAIAEGIA